MSLISSFETINSKGRPDPNIFLWIPASVADAAAVNINEIKALLANGLSTFFIKGNLVFSNGPRSLPKNPPGWTILWNWVFDNFILADEPLSKALRSFETYVLVNNSLCGELSSSFESPETFDESFKITSVLFFIPDFIIILSQFLVKNQRLFPLLLQ